MDVKDKSIDQLLADLNAKDAPQKDEKVVYGVYDSQKQSFWVRINDFLVDRSKVNMKEKSYFFHLLAVMLDAGIPILKALKILTNKVESQHFRRVINTLAYDVEHGKKLSDAMSKFPDVFTEAEVGVVKSGESIGNLEKMLFKLSVQIERMYALYLKVKGAMIYPITVLVALIAAMWIIMTMVIPKLEDFFLESDIALPWITVAVLTISRFLADYWWFVLILVLLSFAFWSFYVGTKMGRLRWDRFKLNMPIFGELIRKALLSRIVRLLGVLMHAGIPINKTLEILAGTSGNELYRIKLLDIKKSVEQGEKVSDNMAQVPFLFPETVTQMLEIGEQSASLAMASEKVADHYEMEVDHSLRNMTTILEPFIIIVVGFAVAVVALAILGPIFSLSDVV
ncbi:MAG: type II secretion system F family protein [Patescibacteria group bacterium]|nr:type II secretion system F family protein [Patescibacteria group bacterium]